MEVVVDHHIILEMTIYFPAVLFSELELLCHSKVSEARDPSKDSKDLCEETTCHVR